MYICIYIHIYTYCLINANLNTSIYTYTFHCEHAYCFVSVFVDTLIVNKLESRVIHNDKSPRKNSKAVKPHVYLYIYTYTYTYFSVYIILPMYYLFDDPHKATPSHQIGRVWPIFWPITYWP